MRGKAQLKVIIKEWWLNGLVSKFDFMVLILHLLAGIPEQNRASHCSVLSKSLWSRERSDGVFTQVKMLNQIRILSKVL